LGVSKLSYTYDSAEPLEHRNSKDIGSLDRMRQYAIVQVGLKGVHQRCDAEIIPEEPRSGEEEFLA